MKTNLVYIALAVLLFGGIILIRNASDTTRVAAVTQYDSFAQCISNAGALFYGAYWCPHCQDQKKQFDNSSKLPYVECSTANGQGQLPVCTEAGVTGYPTWIFSDGSRLDGVQTFETLGEKTNCTLPSA